MKKFALVMDLKDDPGLIAEYEAYHQNVWPEILDSISGSGITSMQIYRWQNRLFMIIETDEHFSFEKKAKADAGNHSVQEWENLMWNYQQALPGTKPGENWQLMDKIFEL